MLRSGASLTCFVFIFQDMSGRGDCSAGGGGVGVSLEQQLENLSLSSSTWTSPLGSGPSHGVPVVSATSNHDSLGDAGLGVKMAEYVLGEWNSSHNPHLAPNHANGSTTHNGISSPNKEYCKCIKHIIRQQKTI